MKFAVIGTGGVGGYFGGKLASAGNDVWFLARGAHLAAMHANGLHVMSSGGEFTVPPATITGNAGDVGPVDVVLFCVKSYDTESAAHLLGPLLRTETIVISLQNGIDNEEKIRAIITAGTVYGGVAYIYSTVTAPGEVTETGGPKKIIFGSLNAARAADDPRGREILDVVTRAGVSAELSPDITTALWKKFIFISSVGGITALTRLTLGEILAVDETRAMLAAAMREARDVAMASDVVIEEGFLDSIFETLKRFDNNTRSSLYYDLIHRKPMEVEALSGTVVRLGQRLNVATPTHRAVYASLLPHHLRHLQERSMTSR